jgi:hypothetical protein
MVILSPIIRLDDHETFGVLNLVPVKLVTVRLQDLISKRTFRFNKTYRDIVSTGGLHAFLDFQGEILLSLIMRDKLIANLQPKSYVTAINALKPDLFTTLDGETYEGEFFDSSKEIERINVQNQILLRFCANCKPIGLVKGCSEKQIDAHVGFLKSVGIEDFVFHVGDFFRNGDITMIRKSRSYCCRIRKEARRLFLYGMGAQKRLIEFSFADVYITFNHFVTAINGMKFSGTKKLKYHGKYTPKRMVDNFVEMHKNLNSINNQTKIC